MDGPVSERAPSIKAIDGRSVHQICSGQVILSLATAVKELVENSIDANAMNIEIKLKDYGMDTIDVLDNGSGIEEKDYEALGLKHYTSKLRDFSDLSVVDTFGFRGEALSSLCALSKLMVTTRHSSKEVGCKLDFDYDGKLTAKTPCAREKGTTVTISQLFHSLPVRHKEFKRNIKKEFSKLNLVLQAYGIISTGVKFNCVNSTEKNKKNVILSTGGGSLLENVTSIFGPKQVQSLLEFSQQSPSEEIAELFNISHGTAENMSIFKISGYISRADHGCGRSSIDRQFYFVNKRPCDLIKVSRLVNEVYHIFNRSQNPFVVLDISLKSDLVDVNVTPDKRQLFMQHEKLLLAVLKTSLLKMFTDTAGQYTMNGAVGRGTLRSSIVSSQNGEANANKLSSPHEARDVKRLQPSSVSRNVSQSASSILNKFRSRFCRDETREQNCSERSIQTGMEKFTFKVPKEEIKLHTVTSPSKSIESEGNCNTSEWNDAICFKDKSNTKVGERSEVQCNQLNLKECKKDVDEKGNLGEMSRATYEIVDLDRVTIENSATVIDSRNGTIDDPCGIDVSDLDLKGDPKCFSQSYDKAAIIEEDISSLVTLKTDDCCEEIRLHSNGDKDTVLEMETHISPKEVAVLDLKGEFPSENVVPSHLGKRPEKRKELEYSNQAQAETKSKKPRLENLDEFSSRTEVALPFSMCTLRQNFLAHPETDETARRDQLRGFRAKISPNQNSDAEEELRRNITKDMFRDMEILGQFNLGFIIAKLGQDLFIIDQHATDEKYNFERLQREHCLKGQKLIQPKSLELTAVSESILIDNLEIFNKNGFDFMIDESKPSTQRVKLVSLPTSKNWTFDVGDIEELIFMLSDTPGMVCRPSRVRSMFASRACRMSTMVGSPLNKSQMKKLVSHMADIEHPWNCPHGRPTMRHLVNLKRINTGTL